uniref:Uncharacterized protein n=1 Tax=Tetranychus urticae TaxID=32264 RepID=T1K1C5_TETUR
MSWTNHPAHVQAMVVINNHQIAVVKWISLLLIAKYLSNLKNIYHLLVQQSREGSIAYT